MEVQMKKYLFVLITSLLLVISTFAQEGMWMLNQIDQLGLNKKGLKIATTDIYSPDKPALYNAVVQLGGGTASFVSPEGLLITNHHVAFGALQRVSSTESDYLKNGFLAKNKADEINAPGYQARLLMEMKNVTPEVLKVAKGIADPTERDKKINEKIASMTEAIEKDGDDIDATVASMYNGKEYYLFVYKVFKDIRIVYAPPISIGKYGGEIDNWMWPRHTGDFSFMRVYVSPDGKGTEFSKDNVPYKPKVWLKVATEDLKDGDLAFIIGFPGSTTRYRTSNSAEWNYTHTYPSSIKNFQEVIDLLDEYTKNDPEGKIKVASLRAGLSNVLKNYQGKVDGMKKTNFVQKKLDFEKEFMVWANSSPATKEKYANILSEIKKLYIPLAKTNERENVFGTLQGLSGTQQRVAYQIYQTVKEMEKPESERQPGFTEKMVQQSADNLKYVYANYYEPADKALFERALKLAKNLPSDQRIQGLDYIFTDPSITIGQFADNAYKNSKLNDPEYAKTLFNKSADELLALNDPFIKIAANTYPLSEEIQKTYEVFAAKVTDLRKRYIDGLYEWKGSNLYPDANSTMRFTSGPVKGYIPEDAVWYYPFTTLKGVIAKNTGIDPFDAPQGLIDLYNNKDFGKWSKPELKDVPVAFLSQCDITGGNSGSPVMNANGNIIGVAFDGNYEAMISDWQYDPDLQRTISVDIRYVLFITEKFGHAGFILDEMGVAH